MTKTSAAADRSNGFANYGYAAADRTFPKHGDLAAVQKWLHARGGSGDDWEALEDAEAAWLRG